MIGRSGEASCTSLGRWQELLVQSDQEDAEEVIQAELAAALQQERYDMYVAPCFMHYKGERIQLIRNFEQPNLDLDCT